MEIYCKSTLHDKEKAGLGICISNSCASYSRFALTIILLVLSEFNLLGQSCNCDYTIPLGTTVIDRNTLSATLLPKNKRTICFQGGTRNQSLVIRNFKGSTDGGVNAQYIFKNCSTPVVFNVAINLGYALKVSNSENIKLSGTGSSEEYGIVLNGANISLFLGDTSTRLEVEHVDIRNSGFAGLMAKTDNALGSLPGGNTNPSAFVMRSLFIHDNHFFNTSAEAMYIGNTNWEKGNNQHNIDSLYIYNNIIKDAGAEGIQVSASYYGNSELRDNYIDGFGRKYQTFSPFQNNGIQMGPGFSGKCFNNFIRGYQIDEFTQNGIICLAKGNVSIYNNVILDAKGYGIYIGSNYTESKLFPFYIINNTIVNSLRDGIALQEVVGKTNLITAYVYNNLGAGLLPGKVLVKQLGSLITLIQSNNISGSISSFNFVDPGKANFHLSPLSTLAVNQGTNIAATLGVVEDIDRNPRTGQGAAFDAGAYELITDYVVVPDSLSFAGVCKGDSIDVAYTRNITSWPDSLIYMAILSGPDGIFGPQARIIGLSDIPSGVIHSVIPNDLPEGEHYKIRVDVTDNKGFYRAGREGEASFAPTGVLVMGAGDKVSITNAGAFAIGDLDFTIEAMVKFGFASSDNNFLEIVSTRGSGNFSDGYLFGFNYATKKIIFNFYNAGVNINIQSNAISIPDLRNDSIWHHVAVSRGPGNIFTFFFDGYAVGQQTYTKSLTVAPGKFFIGFDDVGNPSTASFIGSIDYVRFWKVSKSETDIVNNYTVAYPYPATGLWGLWNFNECGNDQLVIDQSPYLNNGVLGASIASEASDPIRQPDPASPFVYKALNFNSSSDVNYDVATIPHNSSYNFTGGFTIETYINLRAPIAGTKEVIYEKDTLNGIRFFVQDASHLGITIGGVTALSDAVTKNGKDVNFYSGACFALAVSATKSSSTYTVNFYVDGNIVGTSKPVSGFNALTSGANVLLARGASGDCPLNGYITELKLWKMARSSDDIKNSLTTVYSKLTTNLVGYWRLKEISGQTLIDLSSTNNPGYMGTSINEDPFDPVRSNMRCHINDRISNYISADTAISSELKLIAYPNPFGEQIAIVVSGVSEETYNINVFDITGKPVFEKVGISNMEVISIGEGFRNGMYLVKVTGKDNSATIIVIKEQ